MKANWIERLRATKDGQRLLEQERVILEVTEAIHAALAEREWSRADLARALGRSPAHVTKILSGENNFTLSTLTDIFATLELSLHFDLAPFGDGVRIPQLPAVGPDVLHGPWCTRVDEDPHGDDLADADINSTTAVAA